MSDKLEATPVFGTPLNPDLEAPGVPIIEPVPGLPLEPGLARFGSLAFRTGLLDVFDDVDICCYGTFCTPCLYGNNVKQLQSLEGNHQSSCIPSCCALVTASTAAQLLAFGTVGGVGMMAAGAAATPATLVGISNVARHVSDISSNCMSAAITSSSRTALRHKFGLAENVHVSDFWIHFWCGPCAICQEAREIRGFLDEAAAQRQYLWNNTAIAAPRPQEMGIGMPTADEHQPDVEYTPETKPRH